MKNDLDNCIDKTDQFVVKIRNGGWYVCIKDFYSGGCLQAKRGEILMAKNGMEMMGLSDGSEFFRYATPDEVRTGRIFPKFVIGDVMRTKNEARSGIKEGLPVVMRICQDCYICNNETIPFIVQDEYEFPSMTTGNKCFDENPYDIDFAENDWIVDRNGKLVGKVLSIEVNKNGYVQISIDGGYDLAISLFYAMTCHKWTLEDASDGDFIACVDSLNGMLMGSFDKDNSTVEKIRLYFAYKNSTMPVVMQNVEYNVQAVALNSYVFPLGLKYQEELINGIHKCGYELDSDKKHVVLLKKPENDTETDEFSEHMGFSEGDWIVKNDDGKLVGRISAIAKDWFGNAYAILDNQGTCADVINSDYMSKCHKWTLEDASDGDYISMVLKEGEDGTENKIIHGRLYVEMSKFYSDKLCLLFTYDETSSMPFRTVTWISKDAIQTSNGSLLVFPMSDADKEQMRSDMANNNICFDANSRQLVWPQEVVKHKFEPGDVVTDGTAVLKIQRIVNVGNYVYETDKEPKSIAYADRTFHLFGFEDVKDGDIVRVSIRQRENHEKTISIVGKFRSYDRETKHVYFYRYFGDDPGYVDAMLATANAMDLSACDYVVTPAEKSDIEFFNELNKLKIVSCVNDDKKVERKKLTQKDVDDLVCHFKNSSDNFKDKRVSDIYRQGVIDAISLINDLFGEQFEKFGFSISKRIIKRIEKA